MRLQLDPKQLAQMGITDHIGINLPDGFERLTRAEHRAWARRQIEGIALDMLEDLAAAHGIEPDAEQEATYLRRVAPGIDEARP